MHIEPKDIAGKSAQDLCLAYQDRQLELCQQAGIEADPMMVDLLAKLDMAEDMRELAGMIGNASN